MAEEKGCIGENSACLHCGLHRELNCRIGSSQVRLFVLIQAPYLLLAVLSLLFVWAVTASGWPLLAFAVVGLAFLGPVEMRFLCSHCPFYAREGRFLKCMAPNPFPKLWRPRPWPMSGYERLIIAAFSGFILIFPAAVLAGSIPLLLGRPESRSFLLAAAGLEMALALAALQFCYLMARCFCKNCVNLSCPFNRVPAPLAEKYLKMNRIMGEAWKKED